MSSQASTSTKPESSSAHLTLGRLFLYALLVLSLIYYAVLMLDLLLHPLAINIDATISDRYREALTETRQLPGFEGFLGLVDRSANKGISITLWDTEADALASGAGSATMQSQLAKFASVFAAAPLFETYEVAVQE